jgi:hypothetical protein
VSFTLGVANKPNMQNVVMLSVVMLNVVAPSGSPSMGFSLTFELFRNFWEILAPAEFVGIYAGPSAEKT